MMEPVLRRPNSQTIHRIPQEATSKLWGADASLPRRPVGVGLSRETKLDVADIARAVLQRQDGGGQGDGRRGCRSGDVRDSGASRVEVDSQRAREPSAVGRAVERTPYTAVRRQNAC